MATACQPVTKPVDRSKAMLKMRLAGMSTKSIGDHFGVTAGRVSQVISKMGCPRFVVINNRRGLIHDDERIRALVELYSCGLTIAEIAERERVSLLTIHRALNSSPDYRPRMGANAYRQASEIETPSWIPATLIPRFTRLASLYGEEIAATCIRNAKRFGVVK